MWDTQLWYPTLLNLLIGIPKMLQNVENLLQLVHNKKNHLLCRNHLFLVACVVSGHISKVKDFQNTLIKYICQSWKRSTSKQYDFIWNKWLIWCNKWKISAIHPSESEILTYLSDLALNGRSFSVINAHNHLSDFRNLW
jgi:hypothetical protein